MSSSSPTSRPPRPHPRLKSGDFGPKPALSQATSVPLSDELPTRGRVPSHGKLTPTNSIPSSPSQLSKRLLRSKTTDKRPEKPQRSSATSGSSSSNNGASTAGGPVGAMERFHKNLGLHGRSRSSGNRKSGFHVFSLDDEPAGMKAVHFDPDSPRADLSLDDENDDLSSLLREKQSGGVSIAITILSELMRDEKECWEKHPKVRDKISECLDALKKTREESRVSELEHSLLLDAMDTANATTEAEVTKWISASFAPNELKSVRGRSSFSVVRSYSTPVANADMMSEAMSVSPDLRPKTRSNSMENLFHASNAKAASEREIRIGAFITNSEVLGLLLRSNQWDFDIFKFSQVCNECPLSSLMMYLYHCLNFQNKFPLNETVFQNFVSHVEKGYNAVPYHNSAHAADVVQACVFFFTSSDFAKYITNVDMFAAIIAAAIHDLGHRGRTNQFEIETGSGLAIRYNDQSVLENHHIASAFRLMQLGDADILSKFTKAEKKYIREIMIKMVLGTDMKNHFHYVAQLKAAIENHEQNKTWWVSTNVKDREILLISAIHSADISNPCRPTNLAVQWTRRLEQEWFEQGDDERTLSLPISPMMDRHHPSTEQSQVGFISFIVSPLFKVFTTAVKGLDICNQTLETNLQYWKSQVASKESSSPRESAKQDSSKESKKD